MFDGPLRLMEYGVQDLFDYDETSVPWHHPTTRARTQIFSESIIQRTLNSEKRHCAITFDDISESDLYLVCGTCENCFNKSALAQYFDTSSHKCPLCRQEWSDYNVYCEKQGDEG